MQIIIISSNNKRHQHWQLGRARLLLLTVFLLSLFAASAYSVISWLNPPAPSDKNSYSPTAQLLSQQLVPPIISDNTTENEAIEGFYAQQLGGLQAEAIRLKMLSQRLAEVAGFELTDFDLDLAPGMGGVEQNGEWLTSKEFEQGLLNLNEEFAKQYDTLSALQDYLLTTDNITSAIPLGRPVKDGWVSSFYGYRVDPFHGRKTFHNGIDFAGKTGSPVYAVADGIVSWAGMRGGYGGLVEIDHGNGYVTRYAHNKSIEVKAGDKLSKGDVIALLGSTGRSTGPHVHYEVLKDGKSVNPHNYID